MALRIQALDGLDVVIDGITDILDLSAVAELPETAFKVLFFDGSQILGHMAVEAVAHIGTVGNILDDAVHFSELLHLETAETLCRGSVDGVKPAVCFLELIDLFVDIFQNFEGESAVLGDGLAICKAPEAHLKP